MRIAMHWRRTRFRTGWLFGIALLLATTASAQESGDGVLAIVVPADASSDTVEMADVALIYRRKKLLWDGGSRVLPLNLPADHPLRLQFSSAVLKQTPESLEDYWNQQYFQGVRPPHVVASEAAVLRFVGATRHAIGYLSYCAMDASVRAVLLIDASGRMLNPASRLACPTRSP